MSDRPEWVVCVFVDVADNVDKLSWCGRPVGQEFHFVSIDHAAVNAKKHGRLVACPDCVDAIVNVLRETGK
jgi:hypothetical protein